MTSGRSSVFSRFTSGGFDWHVCVWSSDCDVECGYHNGSPSSDSFRSLFTSRKMIAALGRFPQIIIFAHTSYFSHLVTAGLLLLPVF